MGLGDGGDEQIWQPDIAMLRGATKRSLDVQRRIAMVSSKAASSAWETSTAADSPLRVISTCSCVAATAATSSESLAFAFVTATVASRP